MVVKEVGPLLKRLCAGERVEVFPEQDWPEVLDVPGVEVKYRILRGWMAYGGWLRALARCLGSEAICETVGERFFVKLKGGQWSDPI